MTALVAYGASGDLTPSTLDYDNLSDKCELFDTLRRLLFCLVTTFCLVCGISYLFLVSHQLKYRKSIQEIN